GRRLGRRGPDVAAPEPVRLGPSPRRRRRGEALMSAIELPSVLGAGYAVVLLLVAYGIDLLARRVHIANDEHQTQGFTYHEDHDAWLCPQDQWLWPQSFDPDNRVMRYRGSPSVCNSCPVKDSCTTTDDGRELG